MKPRLLKTTVAQYTPAEYHGRNQSGWGPIGDKVLVLTDQAADKTSGGIFIDPVSADRATMAAETGILVAVGQDAFHGYAIKPKPGDRVYVERYSGQVMLGDDVQLYRLMDDVCIGAVKLTATIVAMPAALKLVA